MTGNTATITKLRKQKQQRTEIANEELKSMTLLYNGKKYTVEFPNNADATLIRRIIEHQTGVKGLFYVHFGDQLTNYLHCSSITGGNLAKLSEGNGKFKKKSTTTEYYKASSGQMVGVDKTRNMEHPGTSRNIPEHPGT